MSREISKRAYAMRCCRLRKDKGTLSAALKMVIEDRDRWSESCGNVRLEWLEMRERWRQAYRDKDLALADQLWWRGNRVRLERLLDESEATNDILRAERDSLRHQLREMTEMRDAANRISAEARQQLTRDCNVLNQRIDELLKERDEACKKESYWHDEVLKYAASTSDQVARAEEKKEELRQQVAQLENELESTRQVAVDIRNERNAARNEAAELDAEVCNLREEIRQLVAAEQNRKWWKLWA